MGARQSVAQPPRQRTQSTVLAGNGTTARNGGISASSSSNHASNGHTAQTSFGEASNRSSLFLPSQTPRPRETRSRSVTVSPQDAIGASDQPGSSSAGRHLYQNRQAQRYRHRHQDQSSDSSGEGDNSTASTGISSLDRLLRLSSSTAVAGTNPATGTATVWLPGFPFRYFDFKCPVCGKLIPSDDVEYHLVVCLTRPRIAYNDDVLTEDKGECIICLEEMLQGDTIARLPCLCIYHKMCIDSWFKVKNSCPEHPGDD